MRAGLGVEKDTAAAFFSFSKALTLGHWKAALPIAELHMKAAGGTPLLPPSFAALLPATQLVAGLASPVLADLQFHSRSPHVH